MLLLSLTSVQSVILTSQDKTWKLRAYDNDSCDKTPAFTVDSNNILDYTLTGKSIDLVNFNGKDQWKLCL